MRSLITPAVFLLGMLAPGLLCCQQLRPCHMRDLAMRDLGGKVAGGGTVVTDFVLINGGGQACTLASYPAAELLNGKGNVLTGARFKHEPGVFPGPQNQPMRTLRLQPGGHAWFQVWTYDGTGSADVSQCSIVKKIRIALPDDTLQLGKTLPFWACLEGQLRISFLVPGAPPG